VHERFGQAATPCQDQFKSSKMKNANIFVDVDMTLIDANGRLRDGAADALVKMRDKGCHLFLWSTNGADYARRVAKINGLEMLFEGFSAKPDIIIDDMPGTALNPFVFDVNAETSWPSLADKIIRKHID
jgi:phosphoglycolate phosphatase-like HAD superfamily hydrolase